MTQSCDVLCVGETLVMVTPNAGGRLNAESTFVLRPGGAESNVASLMAGLGHSAVWASQLGNDPFGDLIANSLEEAGVNIEFAKRVQAFRTGVYFKDPQQAATTVYYYRLESAAAQMSATSVEEWSSLRPSVLHLSGITSALSQSCHRLMRHLVHDRPFGNALISFDVNFRPGLWKSEDAAPELLELAQNSDIVFVGRDEAESLWGTRTAESIRAFLYKPRFLIVKDGADEAVCFEGETVTRVASPRVDVVEPVGAGDAFAAGWLSGWVRGLDAVHQLRLGHFVASQVIQSTTDTAAMPSRATINEIIGWDTSQWQSVLTSIER